MRDVIIIGAGVVGCAIARELSKRELDVLVLERHGDVADGGSSKANTAIVHAGYDCKPGTFKAKFNVMGNPMFDQLCKDLDVPFIRNTSLIIAFEGDNLQGLQDLLERGRKNHVPYLHIVDQEGLRKLEPNVGKTAVAALVAPTGGIVCPYELTIALAENANMNGVDFQFHAKVTKVYKDEESWVVELKDGTTLRSRAVVNAAGLYSDVINNMVTEKKFEILPRRGQYYMVDKSYKDTFNAAMFQMPSDKGKGILVARTVDGSILLGPTAEDIDDREDNRTTQEGLDDILLHARKTWENIPMRSIITTFSGVRSRPSTGDFIIGEAEDAPLFFNAAGIESPGLTSAPAIGDYLADMISERLGARFKDDFNPVRVGIPRFREMSNEERAELIAKDPAFGRIICRCETVTEGEIRAAIRRPLGARNVDAVKRRTRAGMGRCQGGFCAPRVVEILCEELGVSPIEITKFGGDSKLLVGRIGEDGGAN